VRRDERALIGNACGSRAKPSVAMARSTRLNAASENRQQAVARPGRLAS